MLPVQQIANKWCFKKYKIEQYIILVISFHKQMFIFGNGYLFCIYLKTQTKKL